MNSSAGFAGADVNNPFVHKTLTVFKGVLIASAAVSVTITWALQAIARFN